MPYSTVTVGNTTGTSSGPGTTSHTVYMTKYTVWADNSYLYGFKLYWGSSNYTYADTSNGSQNTMTLNANMVNDYVNWIQYFTNGGGYLTGLDFSTFYGQGMSVGYSTSWTTAFGGSTSTDAWTDLSTISGTIMGVTPVIIFGVTFYYDPPAHKIPSGNVNGDCSANTCCNCNCGGCTCVCTVL